VWALEEDSQLGRLHPSVRVLALVEAPDHRQVNQLLTAGARAVLDRASDPAIVANAAVAVARDYVVLPSACLEATIQTLRRPEALQADEVRWMRELARGQHVVRLAESEGYSEREMYRRLSAVYRKLRVSGRAEALVALAGTALLT